MLTFRSSKLASIVAIACIGLAVALSTAYDYAITACRAAASWVTSHVLNAASLAPTEPKAQSVEQKAIVAAKQFVLRTIKRERPRVESTFRMCPSI